MALIAIKRGTRSQIDTAAGASGLNAGEPYLITDENRVAVGLSATTYAEYALAAEAGGAADNIALSVRKGSVGTVAKGSPVNISGYNVGGWVEVEEADANGAGTMPAIGLANEALTNAATGLVIASGEVSGIDTNAYSVNDALYVSETAGQLTATKPTGATSGIQSICRVTRSHSSQGVVHVMGAARSNDVPNLATGKLWQGDASNHAAEIDPDDLLTYSATNSNAGAITIGQPVYVDGSGTVDLADADVAASARCVGLVRDDSIAAAAAGNIQHGGKLTSGNWTSVTGGATLTAGSDYFLSGTAGQVTTTAPTTGFVTYVGHAISTTTLLLGIERPIQL